MAWTLLLVAAAFEIAMGLALKLNHGWTRLWPSVAAVATGLASIYLLALALRALPVGTAYAIWTGIGSVGLAVAGMLAFGESMHWQRLLFLAMTVIGIAGLRLVEGTR